jgi:hypothetical protein
LPCLPAPAGRIMVFLWNPLTSVYVNDLVYYHVCVGLQVYSHALVLKESPMPQLSAFDP